MEHLAKHSKFLHGEYGRCFCVAERNCGPACHAFDHKAKCCGLLTGVTLLVGLLDAIAAGLGVGGPRRRFHIGRRPDEPEKKK